MSAEQSHKTASATSKSKSTNNTHTGVKVAIAAAISAGALWFAAQQAFSAKLSAHLENQGLRPKPINGKVIKTLEQFSFTSEDGQQYHVSDPSNIIDAIAKKRGIKQNLYELEGVCIKGVISKVGNYGHMGYFERQIIVTGKCE